MRFRSILLAANVIAGSFLWSATRPEPTTGRAAIECVTAADVAAVREDPSNFRAIARACRPELERALDMLGAPVSAADVVTASVISYRMAPYGSSTATSLDELLRSARLQCGSYAMLTMWLLDPLHRARTWVIGFHGGAVGHHAQLLYRHDDGSLLLDPTVGLIAVTDYDDLLRGKGARLASVAPPPTGNQEIADYRETVGRALRRGEYRPSDALYLYDDLALLTGRRSPQGDEVYITPGGVSFRSTR